MNRKGRWQHKVETIKQSIWKNNPKESDANLTDRLNRLGMEGWQLVAIKPLGHYTQVFLKRPF